MFLFNKDLEEDFRFMREGLEQGVLSRARLDEAVTRILAAKASLGLHKTSAAGIVPPPSALQQLRSPRHLAWAEECADRAVTLVKDTQALLPLDPKKTPKVLLEILGDFPSNKRILNTFEALLTREGFRVERYVREQFETADFRVAHFKEQYDLVIYLGNVENASNKVTNRLNWFTFWGNGNNVPWFVEERPVLFISLANPYHLIDVPMIKTYINAYSNHDTMLRTIVEKLMGRSPFLGRSPVDPFCGKEYLAW